MSRTQSGGARAAKRDGLYETTIREFGRALDRLSAAYEADPENGFGLARRRRRAKELQREIDEIQPP